MRLPTQLSDSLKVHCVALNPVDALYVAYPPDKPGRVVGSDIAGIVDMIGEDVSEWHVGDRVAGLLQGGTLLSNTSPVLF